MAIKFSNPTPEQLKASTPTQQREYRRVNTVEKTIQVVSDKSVYSGVIRNRKIGGNQTPKSILATDHRSTDAFGNPLYPFDGTKDILYTIDTGSWSLGSSMHTIRSRHVAGFLNDGSVIVAGGLSGNIPLSSSEKWITGSELWQNVASMPKAKSLAASAVLSGGDFFVLGGSGSTGIFAMKEAYRYIVTSSLWALVPSASIPRVEFEIVRLQDGRIFAAGGAGFLTGNLPFTPAQTGSWAFVSGAATALTGADIDTFATSSTAIIAAGNSGFGRNNVGRSTDGITWTNVNSGSIITGAGAIPSVIYALGLFVMVDGAGLINVSSNDGLTWITEFTEINGDGWAKVIYGGGRFVAIGEGGETAVSVDGITWVEQTGTPLTGIGCNDIIYASGLYVVAGANGSVMTSTDGATWVVRDTKAFNSGEIVGLAYGNGIFVAVGDGGAGAPTTGIATSQDGINWTAQSNPTQFGDEIAGIRFGNGIFVAVTFSDAQILTSTDGVTWSIVDYTSPLNQFVGIDFVNGIFIALASGAGALGDYAAMSVDGITWYFQVIPFKGTSNQVITKCAAFFNSKFFIGGQADSDDTVNVVSENGLGAGSGLSAYTGSEIYNPVSNVWSTAATIPIPPYNRRAYTLTLLDDNSVLLLGGKDVTFDHPGLNASHPESMTIPGQPLDHALRYFPSNDSWTVEHSMSFHRAGHRARKMNDGRVLVAGGDGGLTTNVGSFFPMQMGGKYGSGDSLWQAEIYDPNTRAWTQVGGMHSNRAHFLMHLIPSSSDDGRPLMIGGKDGNSIVTSYEAFDPTFPASRLLHSSSLNIIVSASLAWNLHDSQYPVGQNIFGFITSSNLAIAMGPQNVPMTGSGDAGYVGKTTISVNAAHWDKVYIAPQSPGDARIHIEWMAYSPDNGVYVAFLENQTVYYSLDAVTWTQASIPFLGVSFGENGVVYGGGRFVSIDTNPSVGLIMTSSDGRIWSGSQSQLSVLDQNCIAYLNNNYLIGGFGPLGNPTASVIISSDAVNWTAAAAQIPLGDGVSGFAYGNGRYVLYDNNYKNVSSSPDGITWTSRATGFSSAAFETVTNVVFGNGKFVAASNSGRISTSSNGDTWSPYTIPNFSASTGWVNVNFVNGQFVLIGYNLFSLNGACATSPDATTWLSQSIGFAKSVPRASTVFNDELILAGDNGVIATLNVGQPLTVPLAVAYSTITQIGQSKGTPPFRYLIAGGEITGSIPMTFYSGSQTSGTQFFSTTG